MKMKLNYIIGINLGTLLSLVFIDNLQTAIAFNSVSIIILALLIDTKKRDNDDI